LIRFSGDFYFCECHPLITTIGDRVFSWQRFFKNGVFDHWENIPKDSVYNKWERCDFVYPQLKPFREVVQFT
jgi:hypothetical protein